VAKSGVGRGRWIVAGGLIAFVIVSSAVIARRSYGHRKGLELTSLERKKSALESERVRLEQQIRDGSTRSVIVPLAERRLGMHLPTESQMVMLKTAPNGSP
jgi:hypothetical protein